MLLDLIKKTRHNLRHGLFLLSVFIRLPRIGIEIEPFYLFHEGLFDERGLCVRPGLWPCEVCLLTPNDMQIISGFSDSGFSEKQLLNMLSGSCQCLGVKYRGHIVAYQLYSLRRCRINRFSFPLKNDEAYLFGAVTIRKYRGKNLAPYLKYSLYKHLRDIGRTNCFAIANLFNAPSIKFRKKLNARILRLFLYINFFKKYRRIILLKDYKRWKPVHPSSRGEDFRVTWKQEA